MEKTNQKPVAVFGAAPDTGNQGVTALCESIVSGLWSRGFRDLTVFDNGRGIRQRLVKNGTGEAHFRVQGASIGRRIYRGENLYLARAMNRMGGLGNPIVRTIRAAAAVLDISGGDSFSDIYGTRRFASVCQPKQLALDAGRTLVLMPQTYGPFHGASEMATAREILGRTTLAFARDSKSHAKMVDLLGQAYDPNRHLCGVDVAFGLPAIPPDAAVVQSYLNWHRRHKMVVGINISGLLFNDAGEARRMFGLGVDFRSLILNFAHHVLGKTDAGLVLVPHVHDKRGSRESDEAATRDFLDSMPAYFRRRIHVPEAQLGPGEAKWLISHFHWFASARMHAAIAALSSGVPALALAYSDKMSGVFESCGMGHCVLDLRTHATEAAYLDSMAGFMGSISADRLKLSAALPETLRIAERQFDYVASVLARNQGKAAPGGRSMEVTYAT